MRSLVLHPPNDADLTDLRFTAPSNLTLTNISATFAAADTGGTTTDVHVQVNGASIFDSSVSAAYPGGTTSVSDGPFTLSAGQTVDFLVGYGSNQTYFNDGTSLTASITATPEPTSLAFAGFGALGLLA